LAAGQISELEGWDVFLPNVRVKKVQVNHLIDNPAGGNALKPVIQTRSNITVLFQS
jgi:hypothetical protein